MNKTLLSACFLLITLVGASARDLYSVVAEGDSISYAGAGWFYKAAGVPAENVPGDGTMIRSYFRAAYPATGRIWANYSLSGSRIANLEARAAVVDALINTNYLPVAGRPARHSVLCVLVGTNPTYASPTESAARVRSYCLARKAAGWNVLICTIPSRTDGILANFDTSYAQPQNAIFRTWGPSDGVAGIIDFAADPQIGATGAADSTIYFADKIHPTEAGAAIMAARAGLAITNLLDRLDTTGPEGGTMTISPSSPLDGNAALTATFSNWTDQSAPLTYAVLMDDAVVSAQGTSLSRDITSQATPGTHVLKGCIYDPQGNVTEVTESFTVNTARETWRTSYFGTTSNTGSAADTSDPNHNGIPNLVEYALHGDPAGNTTGTGILPQASIDGANHLRLAFNRHLDRTDITLVVQAGDSLKETWTDLAQSVNGAAFTVLVPGATVTESGTGSTKAVTVRDLYPFTDPAHPRRFMRLKVTESLTVSMARETWRNSYFGTTSNTGSAADTADPNHNGIPNLVEYALHGDPAGNTTGTAILPQASIGGSNHLRLAFNRHLDRSEVTLIVQASDTLKEPWTDLAQSVNGEPFTVLAPGATVIETGTDNIRAVIVGDLYPVTDPAHPRRFMRLKVTGP